MSAARKLEQTPEEKQALRERITQDKARARRWAEQRKERNALAILPTTRCTVTAITVSTQELQANDLVFQELLKKRLALVQELSELDIAIEVIRHTYSETTY